MAAGVEVVPIKPCLPVVAGKDGNDQRSGLASLAVTVPNAQFVGSTTDLSVAVTACTGCTPSQRSVHRNMTDITTLMPDRPHPPFALPHFLNSTAQALGVPRPIGESNLIKLTITHARGLAVCATRVGGGRSWPLPERASQNGALAQYWSGS